MASFGGFIASALGGAAKGYGEGAQMEMKKQAELDLKKQLLDAELEKASRLDEITSGRIKRDRLEEETRLQSPAYLEAQATAAAAKFDAFIKAGVPEAEARALVAQGTAAAGTREALAPINAAADVVEGTAKAGTRGKLALPNANADMDVRSAAAQANTAMAPFEAESAAAVALAGAQAEAKMAPKLAEAFTQKYKASQEFEKLKAGDATTAQITKAKALAADKDYMAALEKTDLATHAGVIRVAQIKAQGDLEEARARAADKAPGGGTSNVGLELDRAEKSAEKALARALGVEVKDANGAYIALKRRADGGDAAAKAKLAEVTPMKNRLEAASAEWEARKKATGAAPAAAASGGPVAAPGARPSLDSFRK